MPNIPIQETRDAAGDDVIAARVSGDTVDRFVLDADGTMHWGSGAGAVDLQISRSAADTLLIADADNVAVGSTTGTKIGTATSQKLGFFNATPIVQPANTVDILAGLINLGLRATGGTPAFNIGSGALTAGASTLGATTVTTLGTAGNVTLADGNNVVVNATTGTKIGTATTQKLGFYNATPVVQQTVVADPAGGGTVDAEARTAVIAVITRLENLGLFAAA